MSPGLRVSFNTISYWVGAVILLSVMAVSCTLPKKYQKNKPFVYKTNINLNSNLPTSEKTILKEALINQLDDSIKVRTVLSIGFPNLIYYRLLKPPVFDTINIGRSKTFMIALLNSQGYFNPVITDTFSIDTLRDQQRVTVNFNVTTGVALHVDSVGFNLETPELQQLAMENRGQSLLKKNMPYSIPAVSAELDRLLTIYRDNGYYKITKEDL